MKLLPASGRRLLAKCHTTFFATIVCAGIILSDLPSRAGIGSMGINVLVHANEAVGIVPLMEYAPHARGHSGPPLG